MSVALSISVAFNVNANDVGVESSDIFTSTESPSVITGASFTLATVMVHDCSAGSAPLSPPSATRTVTFSLVTPLAGVHVIKPVVETVIPAGAMGKLKVKSVPLFASSASVTST